MDPILLIIKYLFKKKNINNNDDSINAFFENGVSFPQFIALIFNIDEITHIKKNPKTMFHKKINNDIALQFLFHKNEIIRKINPSYTSTRDQINLLIQILTKQCFKINVNEIIEKCNLIVQPLNIKYSKKSDIINSNCILSILHVLTDGNVQIIHDSKNFDEIMNSSFHQANAPLVINKSSLEFQNQNIFLIQLEILFDFFSEKIKQIENSPNKSIKNQEKEKEKSEDKKAIKIDYKEKNKSVDENKIKLKEKQEEKSDDEKLDEEDKEKVKSKNKEKEKPEDKEKTKLDYKDKNISDDENVMKSKDKTASKSKEEEKSKTKDKDKEKLENNETTKSKDKPKYKSTDKEKSENSEEMKSEKSETLKLKDKEKSDNDDEMKSNYSESNKSKNKEKSKSTDIESMKHDEKEKEQSNHEEEEEEKFEFEEVYNVENEEDYWKIIDEKVKIKKRKTDFDLYSESSESDDIDKEERLEGALLRTLNIIAKGNFHFNNFHESIINDSIPKYVMFLLNIKSIENVHLNESEQSTSTSESLKDQKITKEELDNIQAVIEFLKIKEPTFEILKLDFSNPITEESSAFLFYSNLLTFFYLKRTKKEMHQRCSVLLSTKHYNEDNEDYSEFTHIKTFSALLHLLVEQNLHFDYNELPNDDDKVSELFERANIPMIISSKIMNNTSKDNISDIILYQLQFILDAFDSGPSILYIIETFLFAYSNFKKIKVPRFETLAASIRAKRTSLEFQQARSEIYLNRSSLLNTSYSFSSGKLTIPKSKKIKPPKTYLERRQESNELENDENIKNSSIVKEINSFNKFWNSSNLNFGYDDGIMFNKKDHKNKQNESQQNWINEIKNIQKNTQSKENDDDDKYLIFKQSRKSFQSKLYKLFYYDENNKSWMFDQNVFEQFSAEKRINVEDSITPIVLIINSFDDDSKLITYNLIGSIFPSFDSETYDQIFVYGFCDKTLSTLNFQIDFIDKIKASIKPVFLLVNIPQSKKNLPDLQSIILQIYSFLSCICDLVIVILNRKYYLEQIKLTKNLKDICKSFNKIKELNIYINSINDNNESENENENSENEEEEEEILEEEEEVENASYINHEMNLQKQKAKKLISSVKPKNCKVIFLVDDETDKFSDEINEKLNENEYFNELKLKFDKNEVFFNYIDIKNIETYEAFLTSFNSILTTSNTTFSDLKTNFQCIDLFKFSTAYSKLRYNESEWKDELKRIIYKRYSQIETSQINKDNSFEMFSNLKDEIASITPLIDNEFKNECHTILSEIKSEGNKKNRNLYESEIQQSSKTYLKYLKKKINSKFYWTEEQMNVMMNTYVNFLKNDYFDIIRLNTKEQIYDMIYEENYDIVENQIKQDKIKIDQLFETFIDKINIRKMPIEQDIKKDIQKGTNYAMKETENLREIKVTVQVNQDLKSEIEQDF